MRVVKYICLIITTLIILLVIFRGFIFQKTTNYSSIGFRQSYSIKNDKLIEILEKTENNNLKIKDVISASHKITSENLNFTFDKCDIDPNKLIISKKANCVGYSNFFASTCNYLLKKNKLNNTWKAKTNIGKITFLGGDVHKYIQSNFFKDHDFVIIENKQTKEIYAVDPLINDFFSIEYVSLADRKKY